MKRILLGLFFLLIVNNIFAQTIGTINGVVKDKNTQEVLIGVVLKFAGKDTVNTLSDENGNFSVQLPVGKYNLETSYIGYTPFTLYNINLTSGNAHIKRECFSLVQKEKRGMFGKKARVQKTRASGVFHSINILKIKRLNNAHINKLLTISVLVIEWFLDSLTVCKLAMEPLLAQMLNRITTLQPCPKTQ